MIAVATGQIELASAALERAQDLCGKRDLEAILEESIRIAQHDSLDRVLANVAKYKQLLSQDCRPTPAFLRVSELHARKDSGLDISKDRGKLRECALAADNAVSDRIRAAVTYILSCMDDLAGDESRSFFEEIRALASDDAIEAVQLRMMFEFIAGDLTTGAQIAREFLTRIPELPPHRQTVSLTNIARIFLAAGATDDAFRIAHRAVDSCEHLTGSHDPVYAHAALADCYLTTGQSEVAWNWIERTDAFAKSWAGAFCFHLSNKVWGAIAIGDLAKAEGELLRLSSQREAEKPYAKRSIAGLRLLLEAQKGPLHDRRYDWEELFAMDARGASEGEHLFFAMGLFAALVASGKHDEADRRLRTYVVRDRRERYPLAPAARSLGLARELEGRALGLIEEAERGRTSAAQINLTEAR